MSKFDIEKFVNVETIVCPKCKKLMDYAGSYMNDQFFCENKDCEYCGIAREIYPWRK